MYILVLLLCLNTLKLCVSINEEVIMAYENFKGFDEKLIFKTIGNYPKDPYSLAKLFEREDIQLALRDAAAEDLANKVQRNPSGRSASDLHDPEFCQYSWLSWLPWLECEQHAQNTTVIYRDVSCPYSK